MNPRQHRACGGGVEYAGPSAADGRPSFRCSKCGEVWTNGHDGGPWAALIPTVATVPAGEIRAAVTGGRYEPGTHTPNKLSNRQHAELLTLLDRRGVTHLAHGAALGFDRSITLCVTEHRPEIEVTAYPPDEALDGTYIPDALLHRNRRMLKDSRAQILIALPGGGGTAHCVSEALVMGLEVWEWSGDAIGGRFDKRQ